MPLYARQGKGGGSSPAKRTILLYRETENFKRLLSVLNGLEFIDSGHALAHAYRVGALCLVFYAQLAPEGRQAVDAFLMGFLHDLGRKDGSKDLVHGRESVREIARLDLAMGKPFLDAIENHPSKAVAETLQETCLFDADRLDLLRFGRRLDLELFSPYFLKSSERLIQFHSLFLRNRHLNFIPALMPNNRARAFFLYLYHHLRYLDSPFLYHGSPLLGLKEVKPVFRKFPLEGEYAYATKDPYEAVYVVMDKARKKFPETLAVYCLDPGGVDRILYSYRGVEYAFSRPKKVLKEVRVLVDRTLSPYENYRNLVLGGKRLV